MEQEFDPFADAVVVGQDDDPFADAVPVDSLTASEPTPEPAPEPVQAEEPRPYDAARIRQDMENGVPSKRIVDSLIASGTTTLEVNGQPFRFAEARQAGVSDDDIVAVLSRGVPLEQMPDGFIGQVDAAGAGVNYGLTGLTGLPVDMANAGLAMAEGAVRRGINNVAGTDLSTNPDDFLLSSDNPVGGSEWLRGLMRPMGLRMIRSIQDLPPEYRMAAQAGRVVGENLLPMFTPFALAKAGVGVTHPFVQAAITNPRLYMANEVAATVGATQGAALAQLFAPDNEYAQMAGEFVGSVVSPTRVLTYAGTKAFSGMQRTIQTWFGGEAGASAAASGAIIKALRDQGIDPEKVADELEAALKNRPAGSQGLTAGQLTGNKELLAIERALAGRRASFAGVREQSIADALQQMRESIDVIAKSGIEGAAEASAAVRQQYFRTMLGMVVENAQDEAVVAASKFGRENAAEASQAAYDVLERAMREARQIEQNLWGVIDQNIESSGDNVMKAWEAVRARLLPPEKSPPLSDWMVNNINAIDPIEYGEDIEGLMRTLDMPFERARGTTSGELVTFRSRMLSMARDARAQNNFSDASIYELMAEGALEDLAELGDANIDVARTFSRELNDAFTRYFPGDALARDASGANRIRPGQMLETAYSTTPTGRQASFEELQSGPRLADDYRATSGADIRYTPEMRKNQETFIRSRISDMRDPTTGQIDPSQARRFLQENEGLLDGFPRIKQDLAQAAGAQEVADNMVGTYGKAADIEDPSVVAGKAVTSNTPDAEFTKLVDAAQGDAEALSGLRSATLDWALDKATMPDGTLDFTKLATALNRGTSATGATPIDLMMQNGLLTQDEAVALNTFLAEAMRLEVVKRAPGNVDQVVADTGDVLRNMSRIVGANVAQYLPNSGNTGAQLQNAQLLASAFQKYIDKLPKSKTVDAMVALVQDPEALMGALRGTVSQQRIALSRINTAMVNAGLPVMEFDYPLPSSIEQPPEDNLEATEDPYAARPVTPGGAMSSQEDRVLQEMRMLGVQ